MAIYFDRPRDLAPELPSVTNEVLRRRLSRFKRTSHMMSDIPGEEGTKELLAFAVRIRLQEDWIQHRGGSGEHFDLFDGAITRAAKKGAIQLEPNELAAKVCAPRREAMGNICPCSKCSLTRLNQRRRTVLSAVESEACSDPYDDDRGEHEQDDRTLTGVFVRTKKNRLQDITLEDTRWALNTLLRTGKVAMNGVKYFAKGEERSGWNTGPYL